MMLDSFTSRIASHTGTVVELQVIEGPVFEEGFGILLLVLERARVSGTCEPA